MRKSIKTKVKKTNHKERGTVLEATISKEVLTQIDKSIENIKNGSLYGPIDLKQ